MTQPDLGTPEERASAADELLARANIRCAFCKLYVIPKGAPVTEQDGKPICGACLDLVNSPQLVGADPDDWSELCRVLGGSDTSWTGQALLLIAKSDPMHLAALRRGIPMHVAAWETWMLNADGRGAGVAAARDVVSAMSRSAEGNAGRVL